MQLVLSTLTLVALTASATQHFDPAENEVDSHETHHINLKSPASELHGTEQKKNSKKNPLDPNHFFYRRNQHPEAGERVCERPRRLDRRGTHLELSGVQIPSAVWERPSGEFERRDGDAGVSVGLHGRLPLQAAEEQSRHAALGQFAGEAHPVAPGRLEHEDGKPHPEVQGELVAEAAPGRLESADAPQEVAASRYIFREVYK